MTSTYSISSEESRLTTLSYDISRSSFLQGNDVGEVFNASDINSDFRKEASEDAITCLAVHPTGNSCIISMGDTLSQRELPDVKKELKNIARKELAISHIAYDSGSNNMYVMCNSFHFFF
jgi:hypothetical protein